MNYTEAIKFLESFPNLDQKRLLDYKDAQFMTPAKMKSILSAMGDPHKDRKTVHVTGSKGKGSTASFIASALNEVDEPATLFLCPHLISHTERIFIDSKEIEEEEFARGMREIAAVIEKEHRKHDPVALFHVLLALFFHLSSSKKASWQVLEVGLGGKNDPTSVFDKKEAAVFTPIHLEHMEFLGSTIDDIVENKSGIITQNCNVVVAPQQNPRVVEILARKAEEKNADFVYVPDNYRFIKSDLNNRGQTISIESPFGEEDFEISMLGDHQAVNLMTALAAVDSTGVKRDTGLIKKGFSKITLPGRFEVLAESPTVIADGAHTPESASMVWDSFSKSFPFERAIVILSFGKDKLAEQLAFRLLEHASLAIVTESQARNAMDAGSLKNIVSNITDKKTILCHSIETSIKKAHEIAGRNDLILVCGSLYAAAETRSLYEIRKTKAGT